MAKKAKAIMVQGTASDVGKSILCTALCRIFSEDGYKTAPFKAQNMSNNSCVTVDGCEIGRAQGAQAEAAEIFPVVEMNPILIKPKKDNMSQVVVNGRPLRDMSASEYHNDYVREAEKVVNNSLNKLMDDYDIVVIEGAGSPAEVNLKDRDIVNMKTAELAAAPVILAADIERGGVFASIVGTIELLSTKEREMVRGFIINKFRGDLDILKPGLSFIKEKTGKEVLGVLPYMAAHGIEEEDAVCLGESKYRPISGEAEIDIAVLRLPHISNFTDMDPLFQLPDTVVRYVSEPGEVGTPDAFIIPGTKNTLGDLEYLKEKKFDDIIIELAAQGTFIVGICGGFQMLGNNLYDPYGTEDRSGKFEGLGLLDISTEFDAEKITRLVEAEIIYSSGLWSDLQGKKIKGYEIHTGTVSCGTGAEPLLVIRTARSGKGDIDGAACTSDKNIFGTHLHGLFNNPELLAAWINEVRKNKGLSELSMEKLAFSNRDEAYSQLAKVFREHVNMDKVYEILDLGLD